MSGCDKCQLAFFYETEREDTEASSYVDALSPVLVVEYSTAL
jgi:hypothetical protein